jgi:tetratricopeptide (TPR) repeat protein
MATSARLDELKKKFDENPRRYFAPLANEYRKLGDLTQAVALCRAHLPNQPGHISGHIVLAQALYEARELGESRQIFEASLDLDPENLIALRYLGDIAREQGEPGIARGWYERVLDADPRNDEIAQLLGQLEPVPQPAAAALEGAGEFGAPEESTVATLASADEDASFVTTTSFELDADGADREGTAELPAEAVTSAWESASPVDAPDHFAEPDELLHDLPAADSPMSFFEETSPSESYEHVTDASLSDPFFGAAETAGTLASGELEAVSDAHVDDWFSSAPAAGEDEVSAPAQTAPAGAFEDSFFPDLSHVTPAASTAVDPAPSAEDSTPAIAALRASDLSTIPTPPFLAALDADEPGLELAPEASGEAEAASMVNAAAASDESVEDFSPDFLSADSPATAGTPEVEPAVAYGEALPESLADEWPTEATPSWNATTADRSAYPAGVVDASVADTSAFESQDAPQDDAGLAEPVAATAASAWPPADETDDPTLEVEVIPEVEEPVPAQLVVTGQALPSIDAFFGTDSFIESVEASDAESSTLEIASADAWTVDSSEPVEILGERDGEPASALSAEAPVADGEGFVVEYAEFVPPTADETPYIASSIAVPIESEDAAITYDAYNVGAPELGAHEPFAMESPSQHDDAAAINSDEALQPPADAVSPVEGLLSREVPAVEDFAHVDADEQSAAAPAFVTETMAELYLQQGFQVEALAIYRQLLAQNPGDQALLDRVSAIERGASSTVVDGIAPRDAIDRAGQPVRQFFAHFARRAPRARGNGGSEGGFEGATSGAVVDDRRGSESEGRTAGAANRDEALTVPDETPVAPSLTTLFAAGVVSAADDDAATHLASAFGGAEFGGAEFAGAEAPPASRSAERELSLEHLFRDVPAHSSGAVTLDEYYQGSSPGASDPAALQGEGGEEHGADIEQFTAWLEGLKKK